MIHFISHTHTYTPTDRLIFKLVYLSKSIIHWHKIRSIPIACVLNNKHHYLVGLINFELNHTSFDKFFV